MHISRERTQWPLKLFASVLHTLRMRFSEERANFKRFFLSLAAPSLEITIYHFLFFFALVDTSS